MDWLIDKVRQLEADIAALKEQLARLSPSQDAPSPGPAPDPAPMQSVEVVNDPDPQP